MEGYQDQRQQRRQKMCAGICRERYGARAVPAEMSRTVRGKGSGRSLGKDIMKGIATSDVRKGVGKTTGRVPSARER